MKKKMRPGSLFVLDHALAAHHLAILRDRNTPPDGFRRSAGVLSALLAAEATKDLPVQRISIDTPLARTTGHLLGSRIGLIPILRAGLGMTGTLLDFLPGAEVWHLGFYRDEETLRPVGYYCKLPPRRPVDVALVLDPMLATGGSALAAIDTVREWGARRIKLLSLIAAPEGWKALHSHAPDIDVHVAALDRRLNGHGYIVPGLGDAGDRLFNSFPTP